MTNKYCERKIVQNMSPGDSSLRTGSIWLDFVTGENALDNFSYSRLGNSLV